MSAFRASACLLGCKTERRRLDTSSRDRHTNMLITLAPRSTCLFSPDMYPCYRLTTDRNRNPTMEPLSLTSLSADTPLKHLTVHIKCRCEDTEVISGSLCPLDPKHDEINTNSEPSIQTRQLANIQHWPPTAKSRVRV